MSSTYQEPLSLIIISSISIGLGALVALFILVDIIVRKGWRSMMAIMIPVYVINALYLWPITLWVYLKYGRPGDPKAGASHCHNHGNQQEPKTGSSHCHSHGAQQDHKQPDSEEEDSQHSTNSHEQAQTTDQHASSQTHHSCHSKHKTEADAHQGHTQNSPDQEMSVRGSNHGTHTDLEKGEKPADDNQHQHQHHHHDSGSTRPFFATLTIGVCHCGAGCVLGDIIGEWLVYGTNATLGSNPPRTLWTEMLVDFAFAFLFGIVFQYFSIAPMAGDYSYRTLVRALKADALSLLSFEVGVFGWMAAFQIGIFQDRLPMNTVTYWWMMQIGMFIGHWTGMPVNWWLLKAGIKEPCC